MTIQTALDRCTALIDALTAQQAADAAEAEEVRTEIRNAEARLASLSGKHAATRAQLAAAESELAIEKDAEIERLCIDLAGKIMRRQGTNPRRHHAWIVRNVEVLRRSVKSEIETSIAKRYTQHTLITQALALLPPMSDLDRPVYELGAPAFGYSWPDRRDSILAGLREALKDCEPEFTPPLVAA
jgi:hypothetical protein